MDFRELDRRRDLWLYEQVAAAIVAAIESGELSPGERLPSEKAIAQQARVTKGVVQSALAILIAEGRVYTRPRLGVFVAKSVPEPGAGPGAP